MKSHIVLLSLLAACLAGIPAGAQDLRNNTVIPAMGPSIAPSGPCTAGNATANGNLGAYPIGPVPYFDQVADSFSLTGGPCTIPTIHFSTWLYPGDTVMSVTVSIYTASSPVFNFPSPPAPQFTQTVNVAQAACVVNRYGYDVCTEDATFSPAASLPSGAYWLVLSNAISGNGDPVLWDQNGTVAAGNYAPLGFPFYTVIPSETFSLP